MQRLRLHPGILTVLMAGLAIISLGGLLGVAASAQTPFSIEDIGSTLGLGTADLRETVINILQWILGILALVAVSIIIYGGVLWMTANGRQERIEKAKRVILGAVIGLVIVLIAWAIVLFVTRFITGGGGGTGVTCTPGAVHPTNTCFECNAAGSGYVPITPPPAGCSVTSAQFTLTDVDTAHGGSFPYDDVYLCSNAQARFNQRIDAATVAAVVASNELKITRASDGATVIGTWATVGDSLVYKQASHCQNNPAQTCTSDSDCGGSTCGKLLEPNTDYTAHFPKSIENVSGDFLRACIASGGCADNGSEFVWNFSTGTDSDSTAPTITSTYPTNTGTGYPDRNVPRQPVMEVSFSEAIDMTSVIDANNSPHPINGRIIIEQLDGQGGTVVSTIDPDDISVSAKSLGFRFSLDPPQALEPFAWYRITVQGVEDLCGNGIAAAVTWEFQTNDAVAGVQSVYPTGTNQCPDTKVMVTFGTTMWNNTVQLTIAGGPQPLVINMPAPSSFVTPPYEVTNSAGTLRILDTNTAPVDNNFRVFEFRPAASLPDNTTYTATVDTDLVVNQSGTLLTHQWQFAVSDASRCSCKPYVARFAPDQGAPGQCVSVIGSCFTGTPAHTASVSSLQYGTDLNSPTPGTIGGSTATTITSTIPTNFTSNDRVKARVEITYNDPAFGTQTGDSVSDFYVNSTAAATGPCLFSLSPDSGMRGTAVQAKGVRFGPDSQATTEIRFTNGTPPPTVLDAGHSVWTETDIRTVVPPFAVSGDVTVRNSVGISNPIFFDVTFPPPSAPVVMGHWPTCDKACLNAGMGAQFNLEMDGPTLSPASVLVRRCTSSACDNFDQNVSVSSVNYFYDAVTKRSQADWASTGALDANRWYRVSMLNTIAAPDGGTIANLNYDDNGDGTDDSFSWMFQTGTQNCAVDRLVTLPDTHTFTLLNARRGFISTAYGQPDSCSAEGQILNQSTFNWNWTTSDATRVAVGGDTDNTTEVTAVAETVPNPPVTVCAGISSAGVQDCSQVVVDLAHCIETKDCTDPDGDGTAQCNGSVCDDMTKRCSPLVTTLNPTQGPIGQWATIGGCYFGGYHSNRCIGGNSATSCLTDGDCNGGRCVGSRISFTNQKQGVLPAICGPVGTTWSDTAIVTEVPNVATAATTDDASTGAVTIIRGSDGASAASTNDFTVTAGSPGPGICYARPDRGPVNTTVSLVGKNFGSTQAAGDQVVFYNNVAASQVLSWTDTNISVRVPNNAATNNDQAHPWFPGEVAILKGTLWSNAVNFNVEQNSCAATCSSDNECVGNLGPGYGCGSTGCCAPAPSVSSSTPAAGATGVCRNSMVEVNFDMQMAGTTLNANNVILSHVAGGTTVTATPRTVTRDGDTIRLTYGLLEAGTVYTVTVKSAVTNTQGVHLAADDSWTFTTLPSSAADSGVCQLASVGVIPTAITFTTAGQAQALTAQGYDAQGNPLMPVPGVYDWNWSWASSDSAVANITGATSENEVVTAVANGKTLVTATATSGAGWSGTKTGIASVEVDFCVNPWTFVDAPNNCVVGSCGEDFHMMTHYCRDTASGPLLPDLLKNIPIRGKVLPSSTLMKQYLFKHPTEEDGIGIRVFENPTLLSVRDWYNQEVPNPGSISDISVDGYQAIRDGTSVYVGMANLEGGTLRGRIVLISYNDGAGSEVETIFNQFIKNFRFNTNVSGACSVTPLLENKVCMARDLSRINDLQEIGTALSLYRTDTSTSSAANLIKNAGFETDDGTNYDQAASYDNATAGDNIPNGWSFGQRDGTVKHTANFSVKLAAGNYTYQDVPVEFGKNYIVSGWIKTDLNAVTHPGGKALLTAECVTSGHTVDAGSDCRLNHPNGAGINGQHEWTRQSFVIEADKPNRPYVRIGCVNGPAGAATSGSIWCDDVTVVEGSSLYPDLTAGSFIAGMSVSRWPQSWNTTLGNALRTTLPTDPLNTLENCPANYDQTACWDQQNTTFFCDPTSHVYAYTSESGANYRLYANLEYEGVGSWRESSVAGTNICNDGRSSCSCFDYDIASP